MSTSRTAPLLAALVLPAVWPWPLPALAGWGLAWAAALALREAALPAGPALVAGVLAAVPLAWPQPSWRRRAIVVAGFPLSAVAAVVAGQVGGTGSTGGVPAWWWLAALLPLLALYPLRAWSDAPWFPTPRDALAGLDRVVLPAPARVLDAGCGLGHGLAALHRLWPAAQLEGIEWSRPLALGAAWRCRDARVWRVRRGDMWAASWAGYELVYLFQRPESMARAWAKAEAEMRPGRWLVSLEFEVPGVAATARLQGPGRRSVWVYRVGAAAALAGAPAASTGSRAGR